MRLNLYLNSPFIALLIIAFSISSTKSALAGECRLIVNRPVDGSGVCQPTTCTSGKYCIDCTIIAVPAHFCLDQPTSQPIPDNIPTEIGIIRPSPEKLISTIIIVMTYLSGGVSLFFTLSGAAKYLTSSGNPEALEEAKATITHALGGFLLVFLSVFLLRLIGVDVLHIPGFSTAPGGGVDVPYTP